jgi:hypothetical protein
MPKLSCGESRQTQYVLNNLPSLPNEAGIPIAAAEILLSASTESIYRWMRDGTLVAIKVGGKRLVNVGSLRKVLAGGEQ